MTSLIWTPAVLALLVLFLAATGGLMVAIIREQLKRKRDDIESRE